jgi:hypothetical protein
VIPSIVRKVMFPAIALVLTSAKRLALKELEFPSQNPMGMMVHLLQRRTSPGEESLLNSKL